jgi:hypothetical protein
MKDTGNGINNTAELLWEILRRIALEMEILFLMKSYFIA